MDFRSFETRARALWDEIPVEYREGVDGLTVSREAVRHPEGLDAYTLGECLTESYPSDWEGPDTLRSRLVLYHGSFRALAGRDPDFNWRDELWETLTHELRHHLESLAAEDALEEVDYATEQEFRRFEGAAFEAFYYRSGEALGGGWYAVERARYLELPWPKSGPVRFDLEGASYELPIPDDAAEVAYVDVVSGLRASGDVAITVVLVREPSLRDRLRRIMKRAAPRVAEFEAEARVVDGRTP
ncbi:MAG: hypothetical protein ABFS34_11055 [Gemmatimonadota bacterium]